ncbi:MAG: hypothetical protein AAB268_13180 [Elusimicrobiota bacterium]
MIKLGNKSRITYLAVAISLQLLAALALVALWFHIYPPKLRVQKIDPREWQGVSMLDGAPIWKSPFDDGMRARCPGVPPPYTNVMILSDSILYGSELPSDDTCGKFLEKGLNAGNRKKFCVLNYGQPALPFQAKYALARRLLPAIRPRILFWGVSWNELSRYIFIGETAYEVGRRRRNTDGFPAAFPVPAALNAWLANHIPLYRYLALTLAPAVPDIDLWQAYATRDLPLLVEAARREGTELVLVFCPSLDRDFLVSAQTLDPGYAVVQKFAEERGIMTISLAQEMVGQDYRQLRLDSCCHFNKRGQEAIAAILQRKTLGILRRGRDSSSSHDRPAARSPLPSGQPRDALIAPVWPNWD